LKGNKLLADSALEAAPTQGRFSLFQGVAHCDLNDASDKWKIELLVHFVIYGLLKDDLFSASYGADRRGVTNDCVKPYNRWAEERSARAR
jgi:hypothetical protein